MSEAVFGPYFDDDDVAEDVEAALRRWLPTYLAEADERKDRERGSTAIPNQYIKGKKWNETYLEDLPAVLILVDGLAGKPVREGNGAYRLTWVVGIAAVVAADTRDNSVKMASRYSWAIVKSLLDHPSMKTAEGEGPSVEGIGWQDRGFDDISDPDSRMVNSARNVFTIEYRNVLQDKIGPAYPDPPIVAPLPYPEPGIVPDIDHIHIDFDTDPTDDPSQGDTP